MKITVVAAGLLLMVAGCGAGEPPHSAVSTAVAPRTSAKPYATTAAMRGDLEGTQAGCPSYVEVTNPTGPGVLGRAECGGTRVLSVYDSGPDAQTGAAAACSPGAVFVVGPNWTVNADSAAAATATQRVLGGMLEPC